MRKLFASLFSLALVFAFSIHPTFAAPHQDKDCKDFKTWQEAQNYFESHGGSKKNNYDGLDRDHDGLACENLKGFNPNHKNPNDSKSTTKPAQPVHHSTPTKHSSVKSVSNDHSKVSNNTGAEKTTTTHNGASNVVNKHVSGGKLPKTATDYPLATLVGAIMLLAGVVTFKFA